MYPRAGSRCTIKSKSDESLGPSDGPSAHDRLASTGPNMVLFVKVFMATAVLPLHSEIFSVTATLTEYIWSLLDSNALRVELILKLLPCAYPNKAINPMFEGLHCISKLALNNNITFALVSMPVYDFKM